MAVVEAFGQHQEVDSPDMEPAVETFITEGLLTHFFCYHDKPAKNNVWWLLGHINEQKHWLRSSSLSRMTVASQSSCDSDQVPSDLLFHRNSRCVPFNLFKYYLFKILGTQTNAKEQGRKQWVPPFETEVYIVYFECYGVILAAKVFVKNFITGSCYSGKILEPAYFK